MNYPAPKNVKELRRFLGLASWYRSFVPNYATTTSPLTLLLRKKQNWIWTDDQQNAFLKIRSQLTESPVLTHPDFEVPFILQTDASNTGLGAVLSQNIDNREFVIAYASRALSAAERNYTTTEKECLAVVWAVDKFRAYLEG